MNSNITIHRLHAEAVSRLTGINIKDDPALRDEFERQLVETWGGGERGEWQPGICKVCAKTINPAPLRFDAGRLGVVEVPVTVCDGCMEIVRPHYSCDSADKPIDLTPKWDAECPMRFKELLETCAFPPNFDADAFRQVGAWSAPSPKGLILHGASASGKTTSLWSLFRKLERAGDNPVLLTGVELFRALAKAARDLEQIEWLCKCRILIVDDLGKERCTPAAAALLWEVLDRRYQNKLPFFCSTRFDGTELKARFGEPQLGNDILRRLNDICRTVRFKLPNA